VDGWAQLADCEARNALQVILSGSEILLGELFGRLLPDQRMMMEKILANAQRLNVIMASLTQPDEIVAEPIAHPALEKRPAVRPKRAEKQRLRVR
jgi:hypothetical protein